MELKHYKAVRRRIWKTLLIVPCGIETTLAPGSIQLPLTFNRTMWNWNSWQVNLTSCDRLTFNRTMWNWNCGLSVGQQCECELLIVPQRNPNVSIGTPFLPKVPVISITIQSFVDCWHAHFAVSNASKEDCTSAEPFLSAFSGRF